MLTHNSIVLSAFAVLTAASSSLLHDPLRSSNEIRVRLAEACRKYGYEARRDVLKIMVDTEHKMGYCKFPKVSMYM